MYFWHWGEPRTYTELRIHSLLYMQSSTESNIFLLDWREIRTPVRFILLLGSSPSLFVPFTFFHRKAKRKKILHFGLLPEQKRSLPNGHTTSGNPSDKQEFCRDFRSLPVVAIRQALTWNLPNWTPMARGKQTWLGVQQCRDAPKFWQPKHFSQKLEKGAHNGTESTHDFSVILSMCCPNGA